LDFLKGFLVNFSQFLVVAHISKVNCDEMPEDIGLDQNNLRMKFLALNADFAVQVLTPHKFEEACARERKRGVH